LKKLLLGIVNGNQFSGSGYLLLLFCYYAGITQSEVAFLTETNTGGVMEGRYLSAS